MHPQVEGKERWGMSRFAMFFFHNLGKKYHRQTRAPPNLLIVSVTRTGFNEIPCWSRKLFQHCFPQKKTLTGLPITFCRKGNWRSLKPGSLKGDCILLRTFCLDKIPTQSETSALLLFCISTSQLIDPNNTAPWRVGFWSRCIFTWTHASTQAHTQASDAFFLVAQDMRRFFRASFQRLRALTTRKTLLWARRTCHSNRVEILQWEYKL